MRYKSVNEKLQNWAERTTFHAIPNIATSDRTSVKVIWAICLIFSTGYCSYNLIKQVITYYSYEVETVVKIERDPNDFYKFPTISFCRMQPCGFEPENEQFKLYLDMFIQSSFNSTGALTQAELEQRISGLSVKDLFNGARDSFLKNHSQEDLARVFSSNKTSIKANMISCQYSSEFCYENDFEFFQLNEYTKCYRFNAGKYYNGSSADIKQARRYGKNYGLQLELYVGLPAKCRSPFSKTAGMFMFVHNNSIRVTDDAFAVELKPGTETNVAIDRTFLKKLASPYSDCVELDASSSAKTEEVKRTFAYSLNYTQVTCLQLCMQEFLFRSSHCQEESLPTVHADVAWCGAKVSATKKEFYVKENDECLNRCPLECESVSYRTTVSSSQFPTVTYSEVLAYNENVSDYFSSAKGESQQGMVRSSVLSVNVFYKTDLYQKISEKPSVKIFEFVSNIGGVVGVFLGISLLSFVEVFELVCESILIRHESKKKGADGKKALDTVNVLPLKS
jgi:hypothetical protein